jgi:hypothetical protein
MLLLTTKNSLKVLAGRVTKEPMNDPFKIMPSATGARSSKKIITTPIACGLQELKVEN